MMQFDGPMFTDDELSCPVRTQVEALTEFRAQRSNAIISAIVILIGLALLSGAIVSATGPTWAYAGLFVSYATYWYRSFWPEVRRACAAYDRFEEARTWSTHRRAP